MSTQPNNRTLVVVAVSAGALVGAAAAASTVYYFSRNLVDQLQSTIQKARDDISTLEHENGLLRKTTNFLHRDSRSYSRSSDRKTVSFDNRSISSQKLHPTSSEYSYKTAAEASSDAASYRTAPSYETDYFSPDEEDEDEFFDVCASEEDSFPHTVNAAQFSAGDITELSHFLRRFDNLVDGEPSDQVVAYHMIMDEGEKYPDNAEILWRKAKATRNMAVTSNKNGLTGPAKEYILKAFDYASSALEINERSADAHKWYAIICGMKGDISSTKERIECGNDFKRHVDLALEINPNDTTLHHLQGRFCYEVANLSWFEKKLATTIFGDIPESNFEEALTHFLGAEESETATAASRSGKENKLFIAKCHLELNNTADAINWLRKAKEAPSITVDDEMIETEIEELSKKHSVSL